MFPGQPQDTGPPDTGPLASPISHSQWDHSLCKARGGMPSGTYLRSPRSQAAMPTPWGQRQLQDHLVGVPWAARALD